MDNQHNEINASEGHLGKWSKELLKEREIDLSHADPKKDLGKKIMINKEEFDKLSKEEQDMLLNREPQSTVDKMRVEQIAYNIAMDKRLREQTVPDHFTHGYMKDPEKLLKLIPKDPSALKEHYNMTPDFIDDISTAYFTPSIEDIHVGYECETEDFAGNWIPYRFESYEIGHLRVPYLTKEQIEAEGWKETISHGIFRKGEYTMGFLAGESECFIWITYKARMKYEGQCKDINTFRYICKLLAI